MGKEKKMLPFFKVIKKQLVEIINWFWAKAHFFLSTAHFRMWRIVNDFNQFLTLGPVKMANLSDWNVDAHVQFIFPIKKGKVG